MWTVYHRARKYKGSSNWCSVGIQLGFKWTLDFAKFTQVQMVFNWAPLGGQVGSSGMCVSTDIATSDIVSVQLNPSWCSSDCQLNTSWVLYSTDRYKSNDILSAQLILKWCPSGSQVVANWGSSDIQMVFNWCSSGVQVLFNWSSIDIQVNARWTTSEITHIIQSSSSCTSCGPYLTPFSSSSSSLSSSASSCLTCCLAITHWVCKKSSTCMVKSKLLTVIRLRTVWNPPSHALSCSQA